MRKDTNMKALRNFNILTQGTISNHKKLCSMKVKVHQICQNFYRPTKILLNNEKPQLPDFTPCILKVNKNLCLLFKNLLSQFCFLAKLLTELLHLSLLDRYLWDLKSCYFERQWNIPIFWAVSVLTKLQFS